MQSNNIEIFLYEGEGPIQGLVDWQDYRLGYFLYKNRGKSTTNEDTLFIRANGRSLVFGVSDGAGGHPRGKDAAFIAGKEVFDSFEKIASHSVPILDVIESMNDKIIDLKAGARATLALATLEEDNLRSFSIGDSEIIYWNGHGNELYTSIPHSDVGYRIEAGILPQEDSLDDPERYSVNNLVGDPSVRIEVASKMKIKKGHTILIGSDGVFDNFSHEQLGELVGKGIFDKSFEELCQLCVGQNKETWKKDDDISFVLLRKIKS